ncbi:hypothetical protein D3C75_1223890 [compost metagenome]
MARLIDLPDNIICLGLDNADVVDFHRAYYPGENLRHIGLSEGDPNMGYKIIFHTPLHIQIRSQAGQEVRLRRPGELQHNFLAAAPSGL